MICRVCGNIIPDNATRCNVCGYIISNYDMAQNQFQPGDPQNVGGAFPPGGAQNVGGAFPPGGAQNMEGAFPPGGAQNMEGTFPPGGAQNMEGAFPLGGAQNVGGAFPLGGAQNMGGVIPPEDPQPRPVLQPIRVPLPDSAPQSQPFQPERSKGPGKGVVIGLSVVIALLLCGISVCLYILLTPGRSGTGKTTESVEKNTEASLNTQKSDTDSSDGLIVDKSDEEDDKASENNKSRDETLHVESVSDADFPVVEITVGGKGSVDAKKTTVKENGKEVKIKDVREDGDNKVITYIAQNISASGNERKVQVLVDGAELRADDGAAVYNEPKLSSADIKLVSCDSGNYPEITLYASVEDANGAITGLTKDNFYIKEKISNGSYIYKEVTASEMLDQNAALNISLIADKSSSISYSDMDKIKSVLSDFVDNLQYSAGDKAELLAIDDIVRQMCTFTNDPQYLSNGVYNMFPEGMTDLYEGMVQGIQHVVYQEGAKCVIAFTDGENTVDSGYSDLDVVNIASSYEVPVYVIGVGVSYEYASDLQNIAESTGGKYWDINDLYDLNEIYQTIYTQQKQMYKIVYNCDKSVKQDADRELVISMVDDKYCANIDTVAKPVNVDRTAVEKKHSSRYELVVSDAPWEEANEAANRAGGHLVTITSQAEQDTIIKMAEEQGINFVWLGGYTSYDEKGQPFGHWVTGEDFSYQAWCRDEPSRTDEDGEPEWYIMLWNVPSLGGWSWNDQRNDPASALDYFKGKMAYVIEYEY